MRRPLRQVALAAALLLGGLAIIGCGGANRLETGYAYTPLRATEVQRRAFYADPYSGEAQRAAQEAGQDAATLNNRGRSGGRGGR